MRKSIAFFVLLLFFNSPGQAMDEESFGLYGGGALANVSAAGLTSKNRPGLWAGLYWERPITHAISFVPELAFVHKGYDVSSTESIRLYYLEIPLLLKGYFNEANTTFYGLLGPSVGVLIQKTYSSSDGRVHNLPESFTNSSEISLQIGLGTEFWVSNLWRMGIQGRFSYGLTSPLTAASSGNRVFLVALTFSRAEEYRHDNMAVRAKEFVDRKVSPPEDRRGEFKDEHMTPQPLESSVENEKAKAETEEEVIQLDESTELSSEIPPTDAK